MMRAPELIQRLDCGELRMRVERAWLPLEELCGFANRRNRKRGFLFVSKVLGKHYPVRPSKMREVHQLLADQLSDLPAPVVVIGLAETAVALGQGVYECLWKSGGKESLYLHSTRYASARPLMLSFEESHSHATGHRLYWPENAGQRELLARARSLVIVDDELSTGNTICNLLAGCLAHCPQARQLRIASITDWLAPERRQAIAARFPGHQLAFANILQGSFTFESDTEFDCGAPINVTGAGELKDGLLGHNFGRFGQAGQLSFDFEPWRRSLDLRKGQKVLVLGSGEFMYPPFLLAEWLEGQGHDVRFQSTTRSPILTGGAVQYAVETVDNYWDAIPNFLYNVRPGQYDRVLIGYETKPLPPGHDLPERLNASVLEFA